MRRWLLAGEGNTKPLSHLDRVGTLPRAPVQYAKNPGFYCRANQICGYLPKETGVLYRGSEQVLAIFTFLKVERVGPLTGLMSGWRAASG
jgi:hypothetical protein